MFDLLAYVFGVIKFLILCHGSIDSKGLPQQLGPLFFVYQNLHDLILYGLWFVRPKWCRTISVLGMVSSLLGISVGYYSM